VDGQLIEFRTQNHRSLRDEQVLSLVAASESHPGLIHPAGLDETLLSVAAIYGANASGKSNVLDALAFMARAVAYSQTVWQPDEGVQRQPNLLGADPSEPSMFAVQIMVTGVRYEFGFAVTDDEVVEEWLKAWGETGRKQEWYSRDRQSFDFGRNLSGENKAIEALTRPNSLFLSAAAQNNHPQLTPIYQWFSKRLRVVDFSGSTSRELRLRGSHGWWSQFSEKNLLQTWLFPDDIDRRRKQVRSLLASSDLGIEDFMVEDDRPSASRGHQAGASPRRPRLTFAHESKSNSSRVWFDLEQESTGTQLLVSMLPYLLPILDEGGLLAIDELNSLHPTLALAIVQLFQDPARNPRGAQLLFNTHESTLLGNLLGDPPPLGRDQVWLTEKDRDGATHLYPLTDFKPRPTENLQRGYLQGRYGAIPFIGSLDLTAKNESDAT
jgi:uncharacterized protein